MMIVSCFDPSKPNYQYFPNMYESIGYKTCLLYTSPSPRDGRISRMPSSA